MLDDATKQWVKKSTFISEPVYELFMSQVDATVWFSTLGVNPNPMLKLDV